MLSLCNRAMWNTLSCTGIGQDALSPGARVVQCAQLTPCAKHGIILGQKKCPRNVETAAWVSP